jgi:hypothetical protein
VADKCDQHIFDKIYHTLRALIPEFLSGKVLPDFDTVKHRVWSNPLRDVDVERVKLHYRKVASKNQPNNPVINLGICFKEILFHGEVQKIWVRMA